MTDEGDGHRHGHDHDHDVVVVGGGPAGCSAGVFCAREGLDTVIFDRGRSSIQRCAHLENYLGFPAGVDIETFYDLMHEHAETAGCEIVPDLVDAVERIDERGFRVTPQEGPSVSTRRVVAATRYDGEYMRGLDDDAAMFETDDHGGEERETFDGTYAAHDGTTPVEGLYVASPSAEADMQAIIAAGRGGRVARRVIADARADDGWWEAVASRPDWVRREVELDDEWTERETWVEWFDGYLGSDAPVDPGSERYRRVRHAAIEDARGSYLAPEEIETRGETGHERLADALDVDTVVGVFDDEALLAAMDDDVVRAYVESDRDSQPAEASD